MAAPESVTHLNDDQLCQMVADALACDTSGVLPDGPLRAFAEQWEALPGGPGINTYSLCRGLVLAEAAYRFMNSRPFTV